MRMSFGKNKIGNYVCLLPLCFSLIFAGCEIGLGPAIDTEAPEVSVLRPDTNEIKRMSFDVVGECYDDNEVESIQIVRLYNNENKDLSWTDLGNVIPKRFDGGKSGWTGEWTFPIEFDTSINKWVCKTSDKTTVLEVNIDGTTVPLMDGTYIIDVRSYDASGRQSTIASRVFDIDRMEPFLLLSAPSTFKKEDGASVYGRSVTIRGVTADNHSAKYLRVKAYEADGTEIVLPKNEFSNFDMATTTVTIAAYSEKCASGENVDQSIEDLHKNYMALFGESGKTFGTPIKDVPEKDIYLSIELEDDIGNKTGDNSPYVYCGSALIPAIRSAIGDSDAKFEASDGKMILDGTYNRSTYVGEKGKIVEEILLGKKDDRDAYLSYDNEEGKNLLYFSVCPDNAVHYSIGGFAVGGSTWGPITNRGVLTVKMTPGRDGGSIDSQSVSVKIYESDSSGNKISDIPMFTSDKDNCPECFTNDSDVPVYGLTGGISEGTYRLKLELTKATFKSDCYYLVEINGTDLNGIEMVGDAVYGFLIQTSGLSSSISSNQDGESRDLSQVSSGLAVQISDPECQSHIVDEAVKYTIEYYKGYCGSLGATSTAERIGDYSDSIIGNNLSPAYSSSIYEAIIPLRNFPSSLNGKNSTIVVTATPFNGIKKDGGNPVKFILHVDDEKPVIRIKENKSELDSKKINVENSIYYLKNSNGKYQYELRGTVSDVEGTGIKTVEYSLDGASWKAIDSIPVGAKDETSWIQKLEIAPGEGKSISLRATDVAGNVSETLTFDNLVFGSAVPSVELVQPDAVPEYSNEAKEYVFKITGDETNKIKSVKVDVFKDSVNQNIAPTTSTLGLPNATASITIPKDNGKWRIEVSAENISGGVSKLYTVSTIVDYTAPVINKFGISGSSMEAYSATTLRFDGECIENSGLSSIKYWITPPSLIDTKPITVAATGNTFSITPTEFSSDGNGKNVLHVVAIDVAGNESNPFDEPIVIDQNAPAISVNYYDEDRDGANVENSVPSRIYYGPNKSISMTIYGLVSDAGGVKNLEFSLDGTKIEPSVSYTTASLTKDSPATSFVTPTSRWTDLTDDNRSSVKAWKAEFNQTQIDDVTSTGGVLTVYAIDKAGHKSSVQSLTTLVKDDSKPVITFTGPKEGDLITEKDIVGGKLSVRGTWSDTGSGNSTLQWSVNNTEWYDSDEAPSGTALVSWVALIPQEKLPAGNATIIKFRATDAAGNVSEGEIKNLKFDYNVPTIALSSPSSLEQYYNNSASPLLVKLVASDADNVGKPSIVIDSAKKNNIDTSLPKFDDDGNGNGTLTFQRDGSDDGSWTFTAHAEDSAGRSSTKLTLSTVIDGTKPTNPTGFKVEELDYNPDSWFKSDVIRVKGVSTETGSGISQIYYQVSDSEPTDIRTTRDGTTTGSSGVPFSFTVSGLGQKANDVWILVEDKAGNTSDLTKIQIQIDKQIPEISSNYYTYDGKTFARAVGKVRSNKANDLIIYGNVSDVNSGVKNISFKIGDNVVPATLTYSNDEIGTVNSASDLPTFDKPLSVSVKSYKAVIAKERLSQGDVRAIVVDQAENTKQELLFSIVVDQTNPKLTLVSPITRIDSVGEELAVNGEVVISGKAEDEEMASVVLSYRVEGGETVILPEKTGPNAGNWSFTLQMTKVDSRVVKFIDDSVYTGSPKRLYVNVKATDAAGNTNEQNYQYSLDPAGDRPVLILNNVDLKTSSVSMSDSTPVWLRSRTIYGSIQDDDGIKSLGYRIGDSGDFESLDVNNGSWNLTLNSDGEKIIYFKVVDSEDTEFISALSGSTQYLSPKLENSGTNYSLSTSVLNLKVDTQGPNVGEIKYETYNKNTDSYALPSDDFASGLFGGDYTKVKLSFTATDDNGISKAIVKIEDTDVSVEAKDTATPGTFVTDEIAFGGITSGTYRILVEVTDNAGTTTTRTANFLIDNDKPDITITVPSGSVKSVSTVYGTVSKVGAKVYFAVTNDSSSAPAKDAILTDADVLANELAVNKWMQIKDATLAWNVYFDDKPGASASHTYLIKKYLEKVLNMTPEAFKDYDAETNVRFHIMAIDRHGNTGVGYKSITVDPQGDRPSVSISYPSSDGTVLGGAIKVMGTATDNEEAKKVGLFIDVNNNGHWDYDDVQKLKTDNPSFKFGQLDPDAKTFVEKSPVAGLSETDAKPYALMLDVKNSSWSVTLNESRTLDPDKNKGETSTNVKIWAFAVDNNGNSSTTVESKNMPTRTFIIDKDSPKITNGELVNSKGASKDYEEGASIKGKWKYKAIIYDDIGIASVMVDKTPVVINGEPQISAKPGVVVTKYNGGLGNGFEITIDIGSDVNGVVEMQKHTISFTEKKDSNPQSGTKDVIVNVDNMAPVIIERGTTGFNIKDYSQGDGRVVNINGFYTFGSKAKEDASSSGVNQTGIDRVAFYITRDVAKNVGLFDVLNPLASSKIADYKNQNSPVVQDADKLWYKSIEVLSVTEKTLNIASSDDNIHDGGLVKIDDVIYRISKVDGTAVTLDTSDTSISMPSDRKAKFAIAAVVDNETTEGDGSTGKNDAGYWNAPSFDDGDKMVESLVKGEGTTWTWEANINTKNIGDGAATLHYVVFDKAGNSTYSSVPIFIANNIPRVAGLIFATDDDSDGSYSESEIYSYHDVYKGGVSGGRDVTKASFPMESTDDDPVSIAIVRNKMQVSPEIVGGNGNLSVETVLSKRNAANTGWDNSYTSLDEDITNVGTIDGTAQNVDVEYSVFDMVKANVADGEHQKLSLTITDSTPGEAMVAKVDVVVTIALTDVKIPETYITPLYWNGRDDNSLFNNSLDNGHIEISSDLNFEGSLFKDSTGRLDKDPKVSGKIRLEGVAIDNNQLSRLELKVFEGTATKKTYTMGSFENGSWTVGDSYKLDSNGNFVGDEGVAFEFEKATFKELKDSGIISSIPSGKKPNSLVPYFTQEYGHVVKWNAYVDTEKLVKKNFSGKSAKADIIFVVVAKDRGNPVLNSRKDDVEYKEQFKNDSDRLPIQSGGNDGKAAMTDWYRVDVVPYISGVKTELSENPSANERTALGHYTVRTKGNSATMSAGETIELRGFNLGTGTAFNASELAMSKKYSITVDGVESLNNINNDNAKGFYTETIDDESDYDIKCQWAYNRQPNGEENNYLTDDVYFDVWMINSDAGMPYAGGRLEQLTMKVNPANGKLGFGFINGPFYYSMANNIYESYKGDRVTGGDFCSSASFTYDEFGYSYGTTMPGNEGDGFKLLWGGSSAIDLENNTQGGTDKQRFRSPSFASTTSGSGSSKTTNLYLVYYDQINDELRFRRMEVANGSTVTGMTAGGGQSYADNKTKSCIVVGPNVATAERSGAGKAGYFYSIGAVKGKGTGGDDVVVLVWYSPNEQTLYYTYHNNPSAISNASGMYDDSGWAKPVAVFAGKEYDQSGEYCKVAVDKNGGVHIASYDPIGLDLDYAYLEPSNVGKNAEGKFKTCVVDSYGVVGSNLTLDVVMKDGVPVPYIGYYCEESSLPKSAYLNKTDLLVTGSFDGSVDDEVTRNWEITTVPTISEIEMCSMQYNSINITLYKNSDGTAKNFPGTTASSMNNSSGNIYGNGTANPVLGYSIVKNSTNDYIETAQLR